eukprot:TRINITY_DN1530_c0_g1_i2.p1 TRINITY_DN1530_c0_g1~~TRINITY_DN1530_c0_g1_i2.p1  ORF type:complete len:146 (+),score=39.53 TRINITY_DN1530_c0_g1_i2:188-625(+)
MMHETFRLVSKRGPYMCNFIEGRGTSWGEGCKIIYRTYATLNFIIVIDDAESELGILDLIHTIVEMIDRSFKNGSELDVIFNFTKVHAIIDEMIQGGMVCDIDKENIFNVLVAQKQIERSEDPISNTLDGGVGGFFDTIANKLKK